MAAGDPTKRWYIFGRLQATTSQMITLFIQNVIWEEQEYEIEMRALLSDRKICFYILVVTNRNLTFLFRACFCVCLTVSMYFLYGPHFHMSRSPAVELATTHKSPCWPSAARKELTKGFSLQAEVNSCYRYVASLLICITC